MPLWLIVIVLILATHRVTRLITRDALPVIARALVAREKIAQQNGEARTLVRLSFTTRMG